MGVWIETCAQCHRYQQGKSHPVWVCGLKLILIIQIIISYCHTLYGCVDWNNLTWVLQDPVTKSHPVWVCGLKQNIKLHILRGLCHTLYGCVDWNWWRWQGTVATESHPVWVCGLKPHYLRRQGQDTWVTPCMGVWIETFVKGQQNYRDSSHPVWVCGLKPN